MKKHNEDAMEQNYCCERHEDHCNLGRVLHDWIRSTQTGHAEKSNVECDCAKALQNVSQGWFYGQGDHVYHTQSLSD
eukprot:2920173-Amphidinium_carterae.1